jgi:hypothetical protein
VHGQEDLLQRYIEAVKHLRESASQAVHALNEQERNLAEQMASDDFQWVETLTSNLNRNWFNKPFRPTSMPVADFLASLQVCMQGRSGPGFELGTLILEEAQRCLRNLEPALPQQGSADLLTGPVAGDVLGLPRGTPPHAPADMIAQDENFARKLLRDEERERRRQAERERKDAEMAARLQDDFDRAQELAVDPHVWPQLGDAGEQSAVVENIREAIRPRPRAGPRGPHEPRRRRPVSPVLGGPPTRHPCSGLADIPQICRASVWW